MKSVSFDQFELVEIHFALSFRLEVLAGMLAQVDPLPSPGDVLVWQSEVDFIRPLWQKLDDAMEPADWITSPIQSFPDPFSWRK